MRTRIYGVQAGNQTIWKNIFIHCMLYAHRLCLFACLLVERFLSDNLHIVLLTGQKVAYSCLSDIFRDTNEFHEDSCFEKFLSM